MPVLGKYLLGAAFLALTLPPPAEAAGIRQTGEIALPGTPVTAFGTIYVDQKSGRAYLADKDNQSITVIDTKTDRFLMRISGMVGIRQSGDVTGPNGFVPINAGEAFAGDGDSTVKLLDLRAGRVTATVSTGGKKRVAELSYDAKDHILLANNPNDQPPFVTLISTRGEPRVIRRIEFANATDHIERSAFHAATGMFYVNIPELDGVKNKGGLAEIDPRAGKVVRIIPLESCNPHGIAQDGNRIYLGCGSREDLPVGSMGVVDVKQHKMVALVPGLGGSGQWALNPRTGQIYSAAGNRGSNMLNVIDYKEMKLVQQVPAHPGAHSAAVHQASNKIYFPTVAKGGPCNGCVLVYTPEARVAAK